MKYVKMAFKIFICNIVLLIKKFSGKRINYSIINFVNPKSVLKTKDKFSVIQIGKKVSICANTEISASEQGQIKIGNSCFINRNCMIVSHQKIEIGEGTTIGPNCCIYDHDHNYKGNTSNKFLSDSITIGCNVWIGAGAIILKGSKIGSGSVIGAGTLINGEIPENSLVYTERNNVVRKIQSRHEEKVVSNV